MKKLLIILAFSLTLTACTSVDRTGTITSGTTEFSIIKIGECEYISYNLGLQNAVLSHKGDCSNPIHHQCNCK